MEAKTDVADAPVHAIVPRPYYEQDGISIYHGDALETMMSLSIPIDCLLTDPPYCSGGYLEAQKNTKAQGLRGATVATEGFTWFVGDNMGTGGLIWLLRRCMFEAARMMKSNRSALVFCDHRMIQHLVPALESSGLGHRNTIIWDKGHAGLGSGFKPRYEVILEFCNGPTDYQRKDGQNVISASRVHSSQKLHHAEKPMALLQELLSHCVPDGGLVLDPFMGSGTTLAAAKAQGLRGVGIERDERNCENAADRLRQGVLF